VGTPPCSSQYRLSTTHLLQAVDLAEVSKATLLLQHIINCATFDVPMKFVSLLKKSLNTQKKNVTPLDMRSYLIGEFNLTERKKKGINKSYYPEVYRAVRRLPRKCEGYIGRREGIHLNARRLFNDDA
jgi:hypothetical protein